MSEPAPLPCPHCGVNNNAHKNVRDVPAVPHSGDLSMCLYCGQWAVFDGGGLRLPTADEAAMIAADPDCKKAHMAFLFVRMRTAIKD